MGKTPFGFAAEVVVEFKDGFLHPQLGLVLIWRYRCPQMTDWQYAYVCKAVAWSSREYATFWQDVQKVGVIEALEAWGLR